MSIIGIGTDIVSIQRIDSVIKTALEKFSVRILTPGERAILPQQHKMIVHFMAKRWAAKEAVSKAFGTGIGKELSFQDIEIQHNEQGAPQVHLSLKAQMLAESKGILFWHISISDETQYAIAYVIASN
ncbi:MAG: holo-ACP synthase [Gammaproteobacteria bacterium CG22_combo_CG10-13_8_21_14_all_40_8]|nr:MAG: holo-ACP synthase [Gammaproteobacteria bacterium CG22_combo_CG10-13_8_21_14_all_40_8]